MVKPLAQQLGHLGYTKEDAKHTKTVVSKTGNNVYDLSHPKPCLAPVFHKMIKKSQRGK